MAAAELIGGSDLFWPAVALVGSWSLLIWYWYRNR